MSADNWAMCPRCKAERVEAADAMCRKAQDAYGKVGIAEFDAMRDEADRLSGLIDSQEGITFREDYEIYGAEDGVVSVSYRGGCGVCGLSLKFEDTHPIDLKATKPTGGRQ